MFSGLAVCLTLCDPTDCSLPGFSVHGIFPARILDWVAISSSRGSSWPRHQTHISCIAGRSFMAEPPGKSVNFEYRSVNCQDQFHSYWYFISYIDVYNLHAAILFLVWKNTNSVLTGWDENNLRNLKIPLTY